MLHSGDKRASIYGYDLGLNSSASAKIADSKVDTFQTLNMWRVPAIRHERLSPHVTSGARVGAAVLAAMAVDMVGLPLVTKPDALASGGKDVHLCHDESGVVKTLTALTDRGVVAAVSPYVNFEEYRAIILEGEARAIIAKTKQPNGWMHNHSKGAEHTLLQSSDALYHAIGALGVRAAKAIGLRFTTVDIAQTDEGMSVLELNDAVSVVYPDDLELESVAREVYGDAARMRLGLDN
jgi:hypothetical protein